MLNIPHLARCFAVVLLVLGLYLAGENTLISADVLGHESGASAIAATAIAITATGLELTFASWIRQEKTIAQLYGDFRSNPAPVSIRLFFSGLALALVYHFDILTTAKHPQFMSGSGYFFSVVVATFVFGPEACIVIASWLWAKARDAETLLMADSNHKDAENAYRKSERAHLVALAEQAGKEKAIKKATERWGQSS